MFRKTLGIIALIGTICAVSPATARDEFKSGSSAYTVGMYHSAARRWLDLATKGHGPAQYNVGHLMYYGRGFRRDRIEAYKWFLLAHWNGVRRSTKAMQIAGDRMTRREIREAHNRAREWHRRNAS